MSHAHTVVWIDHREAHVISFGLAGTLNEDVKAGDPHRHLHHKSGVVGSGHASPDKAFLERVASSLHDAKALLITGPASAKDELAGYIRHTHSALAKAVEGVIALDRPSEGELLNFAKTYFKSADRIAR